LGILVLGGLGWYLSRPADEAPRESQSSIESEPESLSEPPLDVPPAQSPVQSAENENSVTAPPSGESAPDVARPAVPGTPAFDAENNAMPSSTETPAPVTQAPLTPPADETPAPAAKTTAKTTADTREPAPEPPPESAPPAQEPAGSALTATPTAPTAMPPPTATPQNTEQPSAAPAPEQPPSADASTPAPVTTPAVPPPSTVATAPPDTAADRAATGPAAQAATEPDAKPDAKPDTQPDATPPAAKPAASRPPVNLPADVLGADWLLERPARNFTLQLLGVRSASSLRSYLRRHDIPAPVAYFRTRYKGGDWYVIVQGDYPSMSAARAAVAELPADIRKSKPWPRTFANVHADIRKASP
ncbi:MAG TPA: SPOR domain-containing protein, partial [Gammaproteobacteria bacterium]